MYSHSYSFFLFFFFNATPTTEIYTLSLHDALPIFGTLLAFVMVCAAVLIMRRTNPHAPRPFRARGVGVGARSEEHTSELQSLTNLVCRLLLEKKKKKK